MSHQPSPYSTAAVEALVANRDTRIRELEADLAAARRERDDLRNLAESHRVCAESSTGIADRYTAKYGDLLEAARELLSCDGGEGVCYDAVRLYAARARLRSLTLPTPHDCKGLACPCSHPTYAEVSAELAKAERQRDQLQGELEAMRALLAERDAKIRALEARR